MPYLHKRNCCKEKKNTLPGSPSGAGVSIFSFFCLRKYRISGFQTISIFMFRQCLTNAFPTLIITFVLRSWRNRHTRTFEGRVQQWVRVQVPSTALTFNPVISTITGFFRALCTAVRTAVLLYRFYVFLQARENADSHHVDSPPVP